MTKKEEFLMYVSVGALAEDTAKQTSNAQELLRLAISIPEESIPGCAMNAAKVFLAYCNGRTNRPHKWMF